MRPAFTLVFFGNMAMSKDMELDTAHAALQHIYGPLWIKRDDLIDPIIGGNKFRKLKYNIEAAKTEGKNSLLTFGGAYSNHILATARAGQIHNMPTTGIIRGHAEHGLSPSLEKAQDMGMTLNFTSREEYKARYSPDYLSALQTAYPSAYIIPEGGTNIHATKGIAEIRAELPDDIDVIATACGSGGTLAGMITAYADTPQITLLGFSVLKGEDQLTQTIQTLLDKSGVTPLCKWQVITGHHFGGYAKAPLTLKTYIKEFHARHNTPLDYVYTGKMMFGFEAWLKDHSGIKKAVALHTGGLFTAAVP
tara:strand:- start:91995 stop:92915 length:921 start_codon:yes stop_codon:yes gene_type:complete